MPSQVAKCPIVDEFTSVKGFAACAFELLLWINQRRFQMPWRWSQWSHAFT